MSNLFYMTNKVDLAQNEKVWWETLGSDVSMCEERPGNYSVKDFLVTSQI